MWSRYYRRIIGASAAIGMGLGWRRTWQRYREGALNGQNEVIADLMITSGSGLVTGTLIGATAPISFPWIAYTYYHHGFTPFS